MMAFIGVRISWLILARNSLFGAVGEIGLGAGSNQLILGALQRLPGRGITGSRGGHSGLQLCQLLLQRPNALLQGRVFCRHCQSTAGYLSVRATLYSPGPESSLLCTYYLFRGLTGIRYRPASPAPDAPDSGYSP